MLAMNEYPGSSAFVPSTMDEIIRTGPNNGLLGWYAASVRARHLLLHEEEPEVEKQRRFG